MLVSVAVGALLGGTRARADSPTSLTSLTVRLTALATAAPDRADDGPVATLDAYWTVQSFSADAGLRRTAVLDLTFERDGTAWLAALEGLRRFDGYRWNTFPANELLGTGVWLRSVLCTRAGEVWLGTTRGPRLLTYDPAGSGPPQAREPPGGDVPRLSIKKMAEDPDGTLWFWSDLWLESGATGGIASYRQGQWRVYHVQDGLPSEKVRSYFHASTGERFALTGSGLATLRGDRWELVPLPREAAGVVPWSLIETTDGDLLAPIEKAVLRRRAGTWTSLPTVVPWNGGKVNAILRARDGAIVMPSELKGQLTAARWTGTGFERIAPILEKQAGWVQAIREAPDGSIWVVGDMGLLTRWQRTGAEWTGYQGVPGPSHLDAEGRVVFQGQSFHYLAANVSGAFRFEGGRFRRLPGNVNAEAEPDAAGRTWVVESDGSGIVGGQESGKPERWTAAELGLTRTDRILIGPDRQPWVWGRDASGGYAVSVREGARWTPLPLNARATDEDVLSSKPDTRDGVWALLKARRTGALRLVHRTASGVKSYPTSITFTNEVVDKVSFLPDYQGHVWMFGHGVSGPYLFDALTSQTPLPRANVGAEWGGAFRDESWFISSSQHGGQDGLLSLRNGQWMFFPLRHWADQAWVGADGSLAVRDTDRLWLVDAHERVPRALSLVGGHEPVSSALRDREGTLWVATVNSQREEYQVFGYRADGVPPQTSIEEAPSELRTDAPLRVRLRATERFVPRASGHTFRYAYRVGEGPWTAFTSWPDDELVLEAHGLPIGVHALAVRAQDEGGDVDPTPAVVRLKVVPVPLEQRPWFKPATAAASSGVFILACFAFAAARRARQNNRELQREMGIRRIAEEALQVTNDRLESTVVERTRELRETNHDLARAHGELRELHEQVKSKMKTELEIAERIQTSLLPRVLEAPGMEIACHMTTASEVGGDYYDLINAGPGATDAWLGIGDVAGHGLPAGLIMLMVQSSIAAVVTANPGVSPSEALSAANAILCDNIRKRLKRDEHVTLSLFHCLPDGRVQFAGAHEDIVLYQRATGKCTLVPTLGPWLGISRSAATQFVLSELHLEPGDMMVLYTDGLIEARSPSGEYFGIERLCQMVEELAAGSVDQICEAVARAAGAWSTVQEDDLSLVVARRRLVDDVALRSVG